MIIALLVACASAAGAQVAPTAASDRSPTPLFGLRLRLQLPYLAHTVVPGALAPGTHAQVLPSLVGVSLAVELKRRWSLEVGSSHLPVFEEHNDAAGVDAFVRGGFTPTLRGRAGTAGWTHQGIVLGGYRYLVLDLDNDASHDAWPNHAIVANLGLETTRWFSRRFGICVRLLLGFDLLLRRGLETTYLFRQLPTGPVEAGFGFDVSLDFGLVF